MIDVDRARERLIVSQGPSAAYKAAASLWPIVVIVFAVAFGARPPTEMSQQIVGGAVIAGSLLVMIALLRGWTTTVCRFDRRSGNLVIKHGGPLRAARRREVPLSSVSAVIDRRSGSSRAIELVLSDRSTLVVAGSRPAEAPTLDRVAREIGDLLRLPVQLARGVVVADRFEVDRLVERGGMGVVYRAFDRATSQPVALKLMLAPGDDGERSVRFAREIELLAGLHHPHIAGHVAHGTTSDGQAFLAMQWLEGKDLSAFLKKGPLSLGDSMQVLVGATEAVAAVHGQGIVHRDLKPSNLFLRGGSPADLVLLDFGVARRLETSARLTASTAIVGTPHYMAPEQASSARDILPAADIFSLGCIFYECLTGRPPFDAGQLAGVLARILFDSPEPVAALRPSVPAPWSDLLMRMLAKEPARRPSDGAALLRELAAMPASSEESVPGPVADAPAAAERDSADQVLVCVLLATLSGAASPASSDPQRFDSIRTAMSRLGCPIERLADGSLFATILPRYSATDQVRIAARCAMYLHEAMPEARIAVATGRAPLRSTLRVGDAVDRAAQLLDRAVSGDGIRLDTVTAGLLDTRFVTAARDGITLLVGEKPDVDDSRPLLGKPTPCVGREMELAQLEGLLSTAFEHAVPRAAVVVGAPGIGKSRLRRELLRRLRERHPQCVPLVGYGDPVNAGSPYVLLGDALRRHAGIRSGDEPTRARALIVDQLCRQVELAQRRRVSEFLGELCGVPFPAEQSPPLQAARGDHRVMSEQIGAAFLDWLAAECAVHPVALVLEDVQWGDALTVKLLEGALRDMEQGPLCVIALGRPEVEETFPKLLAEHRAFSLSLRPLSNKASEQLVRGMLGQNIDPEALARIVRLAAGNALFLEELIRAAAEGKAGDVPETVLAVLQARLSRLAPEARLLLRAASVLGETFWRGGVQSICARWGGAEGLDRWLAGLVDEELIDRLRTSRFPAEVGYAFRHALVCDAAHGLLTEEDRRAGHRAAGHWLEEMGETDGIVLARHAEDGGDRERAIAFYARAAEQSLGQYDFGEALVRASKGIACGAEGQALGMLQSVKSSALYSMARWKEAAEIGLSALELLPRGSAFWCSTVERLVHVLPVLGEFKRSEELSDEMLRIVPAPEARPAYLRALYVQLLGCSLSGARARGQACLDFIDKLRTLGSEPDIVARGYAGMWRALFTFILGADIALALSLTKQCLRDLEESQVMYRLSLAHTIQSFIWWGLGDPDESERAARKGRAIAEQIRDGYHAARAAWYLGLTLCEQPEPAKLEEAERCADALVELDVSPRFAISVARTLTARVALTRGDWARAEADGRAARPDLVSYPPFWLMASAHLMTALLRQGRGAEAAAVAREDLARLGDIGSPVCSEVLFRVAAAEALAEGGDRTGAEGALREALRQIDLRAATITDTALKNTYLTRRPENRRAFELARAWLGMG